MTVIRTFLLLILLTSSVITGAAQSGDLAGAWTLDLEKTLDSMNPSEKMRYDSLPERAKENLNATFYQRTFTFYTGDSIRISYKVRSVSKEVTGSYAYNAATQGLTISAGQITRDYVLVWENEERMRMSLKTRVDKALFQSLCLKRN